MRWRELLWGCHRPWRRSHLHGRSRNGTSVGAGRHGVGRRRIHGMGAGRRGGNLNSLGDGVAKLLQLRRRTHTLHTLLRIGSRRRVTRFRIHGCRTRRIGSGRDLGTAWKGLSGRIGRRSVWHARMGRHWVRPLEKLGYETPRLLISIPAVILVRVVCIGLYTGERHKQSHTV